MKLITDNIWQTDSGQPGPKIVVIGGMHGNELTGIEVVRRVVADVNAGAWPITHGALTCIIGNPKAVERGTRGFQDHADLNRMFNPDRLAREPDGTYEDARAREMAPFLREASVCVDIHSTNKPSVPFMPSRVSPKHERVYRWFDSQIVVADPRYTLGEGAPATTDDFVDLSGGIGVAFESGQVADTSRVPAVQRAVERILCDLGVLAAREPLPAPNTQFVTYEIVQAIILTEAGFRFVEGYGERSFEEVAQGQVIAWHGDHAFASPIFGVILFPKIKEHWKVGKPVGFLAKRT
jgi:succinylglutamate desuccinylase